MIVQVEYAYSFVWLDESYSIVKDFLYMLRFHTVIQIEFGNKPVLSPLEVSIILFLNCRDWIIFRCLNVFFISSKITFF